MGRPSAPVQLVGSTTGKDRQEVRSAWTPGDGRYLAETEARQPDGSPKLQSEIDFVRIASGRPCEGGDAR